MKKLTILSALALAMAGALARPPNYDESKVAPYTLEDPLVFANGTRVASPAEWPKRRAEILQIFAREMYGRTPPPPEAVVTELREQGTTLAGLAIRRQYRMWFKADKSGPFVDWLLVLPNRIQGCTAQVKDGVPVCENAEKVPIILFLNYRGNHEMLTDAQVPPPEGAWLRGNKGGGLVPAAEAEKGRAKARGTDEASPFPVETIVARGYAVLTACYGQISPDVEVRRGDPEELAYTGVFALWPKRDPNATDNTTALGAWAWALSRGLDLAERIPEVDAKRNVATGCSRLAKTPLLACARDTRFAVCVPNQTGGGGCPLAKRDYGENVSTEMVAFPHWYCKAYGKYVDNEQAMPFDQHLLLATIAPRPLLVEGFNQGWFDTKGEFLACKAASPVWEFLGKPGLPKGDFPPNYDTSRIGPFLGYVRRGGTHGISGYDWTWTLDFADRALAPEDAAPAKPRFDNPYQLNRPDCRIAVLASCDSEHLSRKIFDKAEVVPFDSMRPAVWQLLSEKVDGLVFDEHVLRLIQWKYPNRFRVLEQPIDTDPSVIAVAKGRAEVRDQLNAFIADLRKSGLYDEMFLRWCHDPERRPEDVPDISAVICRDPNAKPLRVGVDPVQEPNAYFDKEGRLVGYDIEFAYRFGRAAKYRIQFVEDSEDELLRMLSAGELDVVISNLGKDTSLPGILWTNGYLDSDIMMLVKER